MPSEDILIECTSARELIERLRSMLLDERAPEMAARYIFRGQADETWDLVPAAFRPGIIMGYESRQFCRVSSGIPLKSLDERREQAEAEVTALLEFLRLAEKVGLNIPIDHKWLREWNVFRNVIGHSLGTLEWPPKELYEALALAQHHGVPTRLLDFTYDPLIAAFFAAIGTSTNKAGRIAIWCIDLQMVELAGRDGNPSLEIVTVPRMENRNLAAQKGLFVLDKLASSRETGSLNFRLKDHIRTGEQYGVLARETQALRRFTLPAAESSTLLDLLSRLDIDRAHLMPSFGGVVRELEDRRTRQNRTDIPRVWEEGGPNALDATDQ